jgi:hypothetical protein
VATGTASEADLARAGADVVFTTLESASALLIGRHR